MTVGSRLNPLTDEEWGLLRRRAREVAADAGLLASITTVAVAGIVLVSLVISVLGAVAGVFGFVVAWMVAFSFAFLIPVVALRLGTWLYAAAGL